MISEKLIDDICANRSYTKLQISKFPTWISKHKDEGIEYISGSLKAFWIVSGEKNYNEPSSDETKSTIKAIMEYADVTPNTFKEKQTETKTNAEELVTKSIDNSFVNNLPDFYDGSRVMAFSDIEILKKMSVFDRILLFQKTHPSIIKIKNGRGGKKKYVEGNIMKMEANIAFLFQISSKIEGWRIDENGVACYGSISVNIDGNEIHIAAVGIDLQEYTTNEKKPVFTVPEMMKNALTDMKKKALADMGFNGDVYRGEV